MRAATKQELIDDAVRKTTDEYRFFVEKVTPKTFCTVIISDEVGSQVFTSLPPNILGELLKTMSQQHENEEFEFYTCRSHRTPE